MAVTTKAEAEALTVAELKAELESRGLPTDGLKATLLETLLEHIDNAANGEQSAPSNGAEKPAEEEKPKEGENGDAKPEEAPTEKKDEAEPTAEKESVPETTDADSTPAATRSADEVTGGTEEPDPKKAKTVQSETPSTDAETAPASEPATTA